MFKSLFQLNNGSAIAAFTLASWVKLRDMRMAGQQVGKEAIVKTFDRLNLDPPAPRS